MTTKTYCLTINNLPLALTLTPPPSWGYCASCLKKEAPIRIIAKHANSLRRKLCQFCALDKLERLWDFKFKNQSQIIKQIRSFLLKGQLENINYYG